jgi:NH3-dependent NAD+ synthetase
MKHPSQLRLAMAQINVAVGDLEGDAELDTGVLPPYEMLDPILRADVEENRSFPELVAMGFDQKLVGRVIRMTDANEYPRRQAAPDVKLFHAPSAANAGCRL